MQAKPTAATYALQTPASVSQFLGQLVAWGRTSANEWQSCGGCNGWELDKSYSATDPATATNDSSHAVSSAPANGNGSHHDSPPHAASSAPAIPNGNDCHHDPSEEAGSSETGLHLPAQQVQEAQIALRQQIKSPKKWNEKLRLRSGENHRRPDWKWDEPLDTWYAAGPPKEMQPSETPAASDKYIK